jgi:hypothetical protein
MTGAALIRGSRQQVARAAGGAYWQWWAVFGLSYGFVLSTYANLIFVLYLSWLWALVPLWAKSPSVQRAAIVLAAAYGGMMLGISGWQQILPEPIYWPAEHPAFGEHPVTVLAGFPWAGVEGCRPHPLAQDRVPLWMGVDAMLVNMTAFAGLFWLLLRRARAELLPGLLVALSAFAAVMGMIGAWQLVTMFD